jgi:uncharacterized protein
MLRRRICLWIRTTAIPAAVVAAVCAGCATYGLGMRGMLDRLARGDAGSALAELEKNPREGDALYQLEHGLLLRLAGRPSESNAAFDAAHAITEDLYTKSLTREAAALALTDRIRPYEPPTHEILLARHYQALDYLDRGDLEGAAVEARRIGHLLDEIAGGSRTPPAKRDLLPALTAALILEAAGEPDNALVCYRRLLRDGEAEGHPADSLPEWVVPRARRLALEVGADLSGELPPDSASGRVTARPAFTAVVFVESGFVPPRDEVRIQVPILKTEEHENHGSLGPRVGERALSIEREAWDAPDPVEIAYWLEIALPTFGPDPFLPTVCEISSRRIRAPGVTVSDVAASARSLLEQEMPGIAVRTAIRSLIKYAAHHEAEEELGSTAAILVNILGAATEQAETRTWLSLPHQIDIALLDLAAPMESVELSVRDGSGRSWSGRVALSRPPGPSFGFGSFRAWP